LATINSRALLNNLEILKRPNYRIIAVVKSNAYGSGIKEIVKILEQSKDVEMFAVNTIFEAETAAKFTKKPILIMSPIAPQNVSRIKFSRQLRFEVQSLAELCAFGETNKKIKVHLKFNTGMNRLGFSPEEIPQILQLLKKYPKIKIEGIMTHLASPKSRGDNKKQIELFDKIVDKFVSAGLKINFIHPAATVGSQIIKSRHANSARIGIGLYGIDTDRLTPDLQPILKIESQIINIIQLKKGEKVSYDGTFVAPKSMKIATIPFGYYEGLPRSLSNRGEIGSCPIIGQVCMNMTMIDITDKNLKIGDIVTVLSDNPDDKNSARNVAKLANTIEYEILARFSNTIERRVT
jgi:alanine racemase